MRWTYLLCSCFLLACGNEAAEAPLFERVPVRVHGIDFENQLREGEDFNIVEYLYYYNGGGVGVGDFDGDGWTDVFLTGNEVPDRLYRNTGDAVFEEVSAAAGIPTDADQSWSTGVSVADVNGDGKLDIYVSRVDGYKERVGCNLLYLNESTPGRLRFREAAAELGLQFCGFGQQAAFFDYDLDGDLDAYLLAHSVHSPDNYGDSKLRERRDERAGDRLLRNDGGRFVDVSETAGIRGSKIGYGLGLAVADLDADGYPDIYVANDFAEQDYLYHNRGDGTFEERIDRSTVSTSQFSMGVDVADVNNDQLPDLLTLDMRPASEVLRKRAVGPDAYNIYEFKRRFGYHYQYPRNHLQVQVPTDTGLVFNELAELSGIASTDWSWSVLLEDLDLDGRADVFVTNGIERRPNDLDYLKFTSTERMQTKASNRELAAEMPTGWVPDRAFRQLPDGRFADVGAAWGLDTEGSSHGAAVADFDNDGDPDLLVNHLNAPVGLYLNQCDPDSTPRLRVALRGDALNAFATGARVTVGTQTKELRPVRGWQSSSTHALFFARPPGTRTATVHWPGGPVEQFTLPDTTHVTLRKGTGTTPPPRKAETGTISDAKPLPIDWQHREDAYTDFDRQKLLPRKLSTAGPALVYADLAGDGNKRLLVGGAAGQRSYYADDAGVRLPFPDDRALEVVDLTPFDADGDGDTDLYAVHGDGKPGRPAPDRLYLNGGTGAFTPGPPLPTDEQGSFAVAFDYDADGDLDIFRGSRQVVGAYGLAPKSFLLENLGNGRFVDVSARVLPRQRLGMLSAGVWLPAERALYLVGEWTPLLRLDFSDPRAVTLTEVGSAGYWQTLAAHDVDGDGALDLLGGNLGLNTDLRASAAAPLRLYLKDFDANGTPDPLLTHVRDGKERLLIGKDELVAQLPGLRKTFPRYAAYAEAGFDEVIERDMLRGTNLKTITQLANVWWARTPGGWQERPLPLVVQGLPLKAFASLENGPLLAGGGDFDFAPVIGRLGGTPLWHLRYTNGEWTARPVAPGLFGRAVRDIVPAENGYYLIGTNDGPVYLYGFGL